MTAISALQQSTNNCYRLQSYPGASPPFAYTISAVCACVNAACNAACIAACIASCLATAPIVPLRALLAYCTAGSPPFHHSLLPYFPTSLLPTSYFLLPTSQPFHLCIICYEVLFVGIYFFCNCAAPLPYNDSCFSFSARLNQGHLNDCSVPNTCPAVSSLSCLASWRLQRSLNTHLPVLRSLSH